MSDLWSPPLTGGRRSPLDLLETMCDLWWPPLNCGDLLFTCGALLRPVVISTDLFMTYSDLQIPCLTCGDLLLTFGDLVWAVVTSTDLYLSPKVICWRLTLTNWWPTLTNWWPTLTCTDLVWLVVLLTFGDLVWPLETCSDLEALHWPEVTSSWPDVWPLVRPRGHVTSGDLHRPVADLLLTCRDLLRPVGHHWPVHDLLCTYRYLVWPSVETSSWPLETFVWAVVTFTDLLWFVEVTLTNWRPTLTFRDNVWLVVTSCGDLVLTFGDHVWPLKWPPLTWGDLHLTL